MSDSVTALHFSIFLFGSQIFPVLHYRCLGVGGGDWCVHLVKILWCTLTLPVPDVCPQSWKVGEPRALHKVSSGAIHSVNIS